ncbi:MAG: CCA tRNA nucleotidyltransferase [Verrucomicrobiae bacterium]|nr:CCA tRNA nucleotidyltransferase [Verrucomicrobiae bacterium]
MTMDTPKTVAKHVVERLQAAGFAAFWVGGCVRDFLLGREPGDFDIATDAKPEQVEQLFRKTIPVGRKFGVVIVVEGGHQFQVAMFRAEADYRDGRRPERVEFANAEADALRRDFTVNGLFYNPIAGRLHDWVGGEKDLRAKIIRTIGRPEDRFGEDHLRMLRAVRFAARLNFDLEPATLAAIQSLAPKITAISAERVRDELIKLFALPDAAVPAEPVSLGPRGEDTRVPAARGLVLLRDSGLLAHVLPELSTTIACEQTPDFHPEGSVFNHLRLMLEQMARSPSTLPASPAIAASLPWAVLLHDIAKPVTAERDEATGGVHFYGHEQVGAAMAERILQRLRFPVKQTEEIVASVRHHMQFKDVRHMRKATLRRLLMRETFPLEMELHRLDCLGSAGNLENYEFLLREAEALRQRPALRPPLLTGDDLLALGLPPGKRIGELLLALRERQLSDELTTRDDALEWVKRQL